MVNGKMFCSNTNLVSSSRRIHTTPLLNFSFAQVIERITLITLFTASTINIISLPSKSSLLPVSSPSISSIHYPASRGSVAHSIHNSVHNIAKYIFPFPSFHHRAIESCPRSGTRALFCLAISPRESLMRNNIGQAVLSRLTAFIRPEIARETTNNCAVYQ